MRNIYQRILEHKENHTVGFAILVDPDKIDEVKAAQLANLCLSVNVDYILWGGSLVSNLDASKSLEVLKNISGLPIVLFPGNPAQISENADALLYLSVISSRNPELLIGQHVVSAPQVKRSNLEIIPTGYIIIDGGKPTTVSYISGSMPIPHDKPDLALCTAWAGELLGLKLIYMDAGSGALKPISAEMIKTVSANIDIPLVVGGGIKSQEDAYNAAMAGAQLIIVGNAVEKDISKIKAISEGISKANDQIKMQM